MIQILNHKKELINEFSTIKSAVDSEFQLNRLDIYYFARTGEMNHRRIYVRLTGEHLKVLKEKYLK